MIELLSNGALASVQDVGRHGHLHQGVGVAGAMDDLALAAGNLMLGNAPDAAAIEMPLFPQSFRFHAARRFALTGADAAARLDGCPLPPWWVAEAAPGQVL
ncbi:allophanate hydrolase, partial [Xanthomonas sp. Kuri4-1]